MTWRQRGYFLLFTATVGIYLVMLTWSLPILSAAAGGLAPFDMRPFGYDLEGAREFLGAIGPSGTRFYLSIQQRIDSIYPALMALTLGIGFLYLGRGLPAWLRVALVAVALGGAVFDYLENGAVAQMLRAGAEGVTAETAATASRWTVLKSAADAIAMTAFVLLAARFGWRCLRGTARP
jgi:hypothetical protein